MNAHFGIKAIAAAVAFALSGAAVASPISGEDLFFTAWNGNPDAASSIVIKLNETTTEFRGDDGSIRTLSGASLTTLTNWLNSLAPGSLANVEWNISGAMLGPSPTPDYGILTTSTDIATRNPEGWGLFSGLDAAVNNVTIWANDVNTAPGGLASTDAYFASNPIQLFSPSLNGGVGIDGLANIGDSVGFYAMFASQAGEGAEFFTGDYAALAGVWTLDFTGGVASLTYSGAPVPLPAAVWLLGSGLIGLMGIGRRKSA